MAQDGGLVEPTLQLLALHGVWAWRANAGAVQTKHGNFVQLAPAGTPDILGARPSDGKMFGIECKRRTGTQRPSQEDWQAIAERNHVLYFIVRSISDARRVAQELRDG